ncbi:MAG: hypothetical protein ACOCX8_00510 [Bacteroidota bacterium]
MAEQNNNFNKTTRRIILGFHVTLSSLWAGAGLSMLILMFFKNPGNASELLAYNWAVKLIDDYVIIGSALGSLLTGLLLSWKSPWGFFRYWWVAIKLVITLMMVLAGSFFLGPWTNKSVALVAAAGMDVLHNQQYLFFQQASKVVGILQFLLVVALIFVSVIKPFKTIKPMAK